MASKTYTINIDSDDCIGTYQSFQYFLKRGQIKGYTGFYIKSAEISNLFYPFQSRDNKFYYYTKYNDIPILRTITFPINKIFNGTTLATELTNLKDISDVNVSFTYDSTTGLLIFLSSDSLSRPIGMIEAKTLSLSDYAHYRLGFVIEYSTYTSSYLSEQPINLLPTKSIYILSNLVDYANETSNENLDRVLIKFPLTSNFGSICYYNGSLTTDYIQIDRSTQYINFLEFRLLNDWGLPMDLNGGSFSISIVFTLA